MQINGLVLGKYRIEKLINHGSFASVFRAKEELTNRTVAIKALPRSIYPAARMRYLLTELSAMGMNWGHPNIVSIHTVEPGDEECVAYIVMEYVDGPSLYHLMTNQAIPRCLAVNIGLDICRGLMAAHEHSIIHRDIKPQNILLTATQVAKISDFGVSRILEATNDYAGTITGTRKYMAPEQYQGNYDYRADIYSTGLVLHEMLCGRFPFRGKTQQEVQVKKQCGELEIDCGLPQDVAEVLRAALAPDVKSRYQTASDMYQALDTLRKTWYEAAVEESLAEHSEPLRHALLSERRTALRISDEVAEATKLKVCYRQHLRNEAQTRQELERRVETHYEKALRSLHSQDFGQALKEMQQAHRLYLNDADSAKKADSVFRQMSSSISAPQSAQTADEFIQMLREAPIAEVAKVKAWLERASGTNIAQSLPTNPTTDGFDSTPRPRIFESAMPQPKHPTPEVVLRRLHKVVQNPHEVLAEQIRQEAENDAHQGNERRARGQYKKLGEFYRKTAMEMVDTREGKLVGDAFMRARLAFAAAGKERMSRNVARDAAFYYAESAALLQKRSEWAEAGRLYELSGENYAYAKLPDAALESHRRCAVCYFNAAENAFAAGDLHQSYDYCEKTLAVGKQMSTPCRAVTSARKLMEDINMRFASSRDTRTGLTRGQNLCDSEVSNRGYSRARFSSVLS